MVNELRFLPKIGAYLDTNNKRIHIFMTYKKG